MSVRLSVDTLGSETSLSEIMRGLSESSLRNEDYIFYLFGNENLITDMPFSWCNRLINKLS